MIKAVFFDIDGTLLPMSTGRLPESALEALTTLKEKGVSLYIASGRPPKHLTLLDPVCMSFPWDGFILMNGQYCYDDKGEVFRREPIAKESLRVLVPWLKEQKDYPCSFYEIDYSYDISFNKGMYDYLASIDRLEELPPIEDPGRSYDHDTYLICPYVSPDNDAEFLAHAPGIISQRWSPAFADMIREGGGKPTGIEAALKRKGLTCHECMAFGDGGNDIAMLEYAEIGVAMGNASDAVKAHADYVTESCDNNGIYSAFKHFGLI